MKRKVPYIIMAPPYRHNSGGIRALYELRHHLEVHGYEAKIGQIAQGPRDIIDAIVVYPETESGNPMNGQIVVRWVLNFPGLLKGDKEYDPKEIIFSYLPRFYPDVPVLTVPIIEDFFRDEGLPRSGKYFWVGKGSKVPRIPETDGLIEITYDWPLDRKELAQFLNEIEILYIYDDATILTVEGRRCGCKVVVIPGEPPGTTYEESVKNFDTQFDDFIRITQAAAQKEIKISFGVLINDPVRNDIVLRQSQIQGDMHYVRDPESATKGLNKLLEVMENEGADIGILTHQDMYYRQGWLSQVKEQLEKLPDSWVVAGIMGKDIKGRFCGKFHAMQLPFCHDTSDIHTFPQEACCLDECVIIVNLKKKFRFDEGLKNFDLYGTLAVLQAWKMGSKAFILDAFAEHYSLRYLPWIPDEKWCDSFKFLYEKYSKTAIRIDSTAISVIGGQKEKETELSTI